MELIVKDAAVIFGVSEKTIIGWIDRMHLPAYQVSGQYRFNQSELLEWATGCKVDVSTEIVKAADQEGGAPHRLDEALRRGGIRHHVGGADKASILRSVVDFMTLPSEVDRTFLYEVLLARESLGSTAIGESIAIPHVRHPIVLHMSHPVINLCFLDHPLDFGAADGLPVDTLFTLVCPTVRAHQHLLSKLAFALKDPRFKSVVTRKGSRQQILSEAARLEATLFPPSFEART